MRFQLNQTKDEVCTDTGLSESDAERILLAHKSNPVFRPEPDEIAANCTRLNIQPDELPGMKKEMMHLIYRQVWIDNGGDVEEKADLIEKVAYFDKDILLKLRQNPAEEARFDAFKFELDLLWQVEMKRIRTILSGGTFTDADKQNWLREQHANFAVAEAEYQRFVVQGERPAKASKKGSKSSNSQDEEVLKSYLDAIVSLLSEAKTIDLIQDELPDVIEDADTPPTFSATTDSITAEKIAFWLSEQDLVEILETRIDRNLLYFETRRNGFPYPPIFLGAASKTWSITVNASADGTSILCNSYGKTKSTPLDTRKINSPVGA